jgi:Protein of unknown function (DUF3631)
MGSAPLTPGSENSPTRAKPINDRKLGRRLREYGVKSKVIRVGDRTPRGYLREDLQDAWLRYLPAHDAAEA